MQTTALTKPKLVIFDVEGVLIPKNRFLFELGRSLGFVPLLKVFFYGFLYEIGFVNLGSALKSIFASAKGMQMEALMQIGEKIPLVAGSKDMFAYLKERGYKTALISSGLPTKVVELIANKISADYAFGLEIGTERDMLTGEIWGEVIDRNGKLSVLNRLVAEDCLTTKDCVVVADDRNNASIFLKEALKIAYNPGFILRLKADKVVRGDINGLMAVIDGQPKPHTKLSGNDVLRETIHGSGIFVAITTSLTGATGLVVIAASTIFVLGLYATSEYLRTIGKKMPLIYSITRKAASPSELYQLVLAPVYFALGIVITLLLFPAPANYAAIAVFALGDSSASIVGGAFSKTSLPFNKDKSLEGSAAGLLFAFLGALIFVSPLIALFGALIAMIVECLPLPVNDNLVVPLFTGLAFTLILG